MSSLLKGAVYGIVCTIAIGIAAATFVFKMGYFSLVTAKEMASLAASKAAVDKLQKRNIAKKSALKSRLAKKAVSQSARSTVASLAGPVLIGAVAVGFVVDDYCDDMKDLHELDQLLQGDSTEYSIEMCASDMQESAKEWVSEAREEARIKQLEILGSLKENYKSFTGWLKK
jgi:hypothetical protein